MQFFKVKFNALKLCDSFNNQLKLANVTKSFDPSDICTYLSKNIRL